MDRLPGISIMFDKPGYQDPRQRQALKGRNARCTPLPKIASNELVRGWRWRVEGWSNCQELWIDTLPGWRGGVLLDAPSIGKFA